LHKTISKTLRNSQGPGCSKAAEVLFSLTTQAQAEAEAQAIAWDDPNKTKFDQTQAQAKSSEPSSSLENCLGAR